MTLPVFGNFAYSTLNGPFNIGGDQLTVQAGEGARFPTLGSGQHMRLTLVNASRQYEIVKCLGHALGSDTFTGILRAQEGTLERNWLAGDRVALRLTAGGIDDFAGLPSIPKTSGVVQSIAFNVDGSFQGQMIYVDQPMTVTTDDPNTFADGFGFGLKNGSNGVVVIDPAGGGQVDDALTLSLNPGDSVYLVAMLGELRSFFKHIADPVQAGTVSWFAKSVAPTGWLKCNGALVSRTTYAKLFAEIGVAFGPGDGTTFGLPDLRGEFPRGWDDGRGVDPGRVFGSSQGDLVKAHSHGLGANTVHMLKDDAGGAANFYPFPTPFSAHAINATSETGGAENRPRNVALLACIKY